MTAQTKTDFKGTQRRRQIKLIATTSIYLSAGHRRSTTNKMNAGNVDCIAVLMRFILDEVLMMVGEMYGPGSDIKLPDGLSIAEIA